MLGRRLPERVQTPSHCRVERVGDCLFELMRCQKGLTWTRPPRLQKGWMGARPDQVCLCLPFCAILSDLLNYFLWLQISSRP